MERRSKQKVLGSRISDQSETKQIIIIVPDALASWSKQRDCEHQDSWINATIEDIEAPERPNVRHFNYEVNPKSPELWAELLVQGNNLMKWTEQLVAENKVRVVHNHSALQASTDMFKLQEESLLFICYGLGSVVAKQAFCSAHNRPAQKLIHSTCGIIFLRCPPILPDSLVWKTLRDVLLSYTKKVSETATKPVGVDCAVDTLRRFDEIGLRKLMLFAPDKRDKDTKRSLFGKSSEGAKCVNITDLSMKAHTGQSLDIVPSPEWKTGSEQCSFASGSPLRKELVKFITKCLESQKALLRYKPGDPKLPTFMLDQSVQAESFFNRVVELERLDTVLLPQDDNRKQLRVFPLCGCGGIGKTAIAARYALTRKDRFDAVFWVRADTKSHLLESFGRIAVELGLVHKSAAEDRQFSKHRVIEWLKNPMKSFRRAAPPDSQHANYLLIFDNADNAQLLKSYWPAHGRGSILITSRDPSAKDWTMTRLKMDEDISDVKPFDTAESMEFLLRISPRAINEPHAREVAAQIGGLPLALQQLGYSMTRRNSPVTNMLQRYTDMLGPEETFQLPQSERGPPVSRTLARLARKRLEQSPDSLRLLNVLCLLDHQRVDEAILTIDSSFEVAEDLQHPKSQGAYEKLRQQLWSYSLIAVDDGDGSVKIHPQVQDEIAADMTEDQFAAAFALAVDLLTRAWPVKEAWIWHQATNYWDKADTIYNHIAWLYSRYLACEDERQKRIASNSFVHLITLWAWYDHERGNSEECRDPFDKMLTICERELKNCEDLKASIHGFLGAIATETNDAFSAYDHYRIVLELQGERSEALKSLSAAETYASATNEMGIAQIMVGELNGAKDSLEFSRAIARIFRNGSNSMFSLYLLAAINLGCAHWMDKEYDEASICLEAAWKRYELNPDEQKDSFRPPRLMYALGNVRASQGRYEESLKWHLMAYEHFGRTSGANHHRTADVGWRLAEHYLRLGRFEDCMTHLTHALEVFSSKNVFQPELARSHYLLGKLYHARSQPKEALEQFKLAEELYYSLDKGKKRGMPKRVLGDDDYTEAITFWSR